MGNKSPATSGVETLAGSKVIPEEYWDEFYRAKHEELEKPSSFAEWVLPQIKGLNIFEMGCGNGRDALYFARNGCKVMACDKSGVVIRNLVRKHGNQNPNFFAADFSTLDPIAGIEVIYSRFSLHAVDKETASNALNWASGCLKAGGFLYIEVRSHLGSKYGLGTPLERDAFLQDGHYRRFIVYGELSRELRALGFRIEWCCETAGLSPFGNDDPVLIRVKAVKA